MKKNNQRTVSTKDFPAVKQVIRLTQNQLRQMLPLIPGDLEDLRERMERAIKRNDVSRSNALRAVLPELQELLIESAEAVKNKE